MTISRKQFLAFLWFEGACDEGLKRFKRHKGTIKQIASKLLKLEARYLDDDVRPKSITDLRWLRSQANRRIVRGWPTKAFAAALAIRELIGE